MYAIRALLNTIREGLRDIGYREDLLQENYGFTDMFAPEQPLRTVELGAFALEPPSYRNACFGVVVPLHHGPEAIINYRSLGAPQIFAVHADSEEIFCWKILAHNPPVLIEKIEASHLRNAIHSHRDEWKKDYQQFVYTGQPTLQTSTPFNLIRNGEENDILWQSRLQRVWDKLASFPRLGDVAEIHRGIEYKLSLEENEDKLVSDVPREGFARGLRQVTDDFEPYTASSSTYLNMKPELMRREAYKLPWDKPKVIANAARLSRGRWLIAGAVDDKGLVCTQRFHGIWATGSVPIEIIAALLNGPIANAFLSVSRTSRDNQIRTLQQIPIPQFGPAETHRMVSLVREYMADREQWRAEPLHSNDFERSCRGLMGQIDAEILGAYKLPMDLEREVLAYFKGYAKPGPVPQVQLKPSHTNRLYASLIRIEGVRNLTGTKVVDAVVLNWNPYLVIQLPLSLFPGDLQEKLDREVWLWARVNIGANAVEDLIFEEIELAPEPKMNDRFA